MAKCSQLASCLFAAFEQNFRGTKSSCTCSVSFRMRPKITHSISIYPDIFACWYHLPIIFLGIANTIRRPSASLSRFLLYTLQLLDVVFRTISQPTMRVLSCGRGVETCAVLGRASHTLCGIIRVILQNWPETDRSRKPDQSHTVCLRPFAGRTRNLRASHPDE